MPLDNLERTPPASMFWSLPLLTPSMLIVKVRFVLFMLKKKSESFAHEFVMKPNPTFSVPFFFHNHVYVV